MKDRYKPPPAAAGKIVDWTAPELKSLLSGSEGWGLDNRGEFPPRPCTLHLSSGEAEGQAATLVLERADLFVVEALFVIPKGVQVRVDRMQGGTLRSTFGTVVDGHLGKRAEDVANGMYVYWIYPR
ncbi:hypothetical protein [Dyella sp.]|uniref:hypothetical protein n=1 Tax=Dyella sp. TaxID=1869338 RepID=UPI002D79DDB5|nr:hypothetical protein [Dyella sp.]HET6433290.1 hypothetical protein [Dyella sp.]